MPIKLSPPHFPQQARHEAAAHIIATRSLRIAPFSLYSPHRPPKISARPISTTMHSRLILIHSSSQPQPRAGRQQGQRLRFRSSLVSDAASSCTTSPAFLRLGNLANVCSCSPHTPHISAPSSKASAPAAAFLLPALAAHIATCAVNNSKVLPPSLPSLIGG
jgi:hypothetical protein